MFGSIKIYKVHRSESKRKNNAKSRLNRKYYHYFIYFRKLFLCRISKCPSKLKVELH